MKYLFFTFTLLVISLPISAQFYNPYNPYITPQTMQGAYEYGQRMAIQHQEQQKNNPTTCCTNAMSNIASGNYDTAMEWAEEYVYRHTDTTDTCYSD